MAESSFSKRPCGPFTPGCLLQSSACPCHLILGAATKEEGEVLTSPGGRSGDQGAEDRGWHTLCKGQIVNSLSFTGQTGSVSASHLRSRGAEAAWTIYL